MFNYILLSLVLVYYNHQCYRNVMRIKKNDPIFNHLTKLHDKSVFPQIIFVPREMGPFEMDHMVFLLNII